MSSKIVTVIDRYLLDHIGDDGKYTNIDDKFVYAFGPYLAMNNGYSDVAVKVALVNPLMKAIMITSYILYIKDGLYRFNPNTRDLLFKQTLASIVEVSEEIPKRLYTSIKDLYDDLILNCSKYSKSTESFITNSAPIVPYSQHLTFDSAYIEEVFATDIDYSETVSKYLALYLERIMRNYEFLEEVDCVTMEDCISSKMDSLLIDNKVSDIVKRYYAYALFDFYNIPTSKITKYKDFLLAITNPSNGTGDFKSRVLNALEGLYNSNEDMLEDEVDIELLANTKPVQAEKISYDIDAISNFIYVHTWMQFDENANRFFMSILDKSKITNIMEMDNERVYYELDRRIVVCPFTDLRDYVIKTLEMDISTGEIEIVFNIQNRY